MVLIKFLFAMKNDEYIAFVIDRYHISVPLILFILVPVWFHALIATCIIYIMFIFVNAII